MDPVMKQNPLLNISEIPVLVLAGGKGTRLASVVSDVPKPMAPLQGKPFLHYLLTYLKTFGFREVILLTGYKAQAIEDYFSTGEAWGMKILYSHEDQPLGTGGAVRKALQAKTQKHFLILNGDTFYHMDYRKFISECDGKVNMALHRVLSVGRYGTVEIDDQNKVTAFSEKKADVRDGEINAGIYLVKREILNDIPDGFVSLETDVFPGLASRREIRGISMKGEFIDIGIPEDYARAQVEVPKWI